MQSKKEEIPYSNEKVKFHPENLIPKNLKNFLSDAGGIAAFSGGFFKEVLLPPFEINELLKQSYEIGYKSLTLVSITGFIMGLVLTIQSRPTLADFGAESMLPAMVAISIVREIGPVITALICAGKVGSGIGAELGSMKVTEQIDAMEVSGNLPFKYLVVTRILGCTLMIPLLVIFADAVALYGSWIGTNIQGEVSLKLYILQAFSAVEFQDFIPATIKTFFFGFAIGVVSCYKGYNSNGGTEGVGKAANSSVVIASLLIFIIDLIAAQLTDFLYY